jgi:hypothetical protein
MYHTILSIYGVKHGLNVLQELKLVRLNGKGHERKIYLAPPPPGKLNITASPAFQAGAQAKGKIEHFAETILRAAPQEILSWLTRI